jgi:hypothetical protein
LRRYGVVFRDLLGRESDAIVWRDLLIQYRRMELRGEIRGGRFVGGFTGDQFALPEAVETLRALRKGTGSDLIATQEIRLSACDPLNLAGVILPGPRIPALPTNFLVMKNGLLVTSITGSSKRHETNQGFGDLLQKPFGLAMSAGSRPRSEKSSHAHSSGLSATPDHAIGIGLEGLVPRWGKTRGRFISMSEDFQELVGAEYLRLGSPPLRQFYPQLKERCVHLGVTCPSRSTIERFLTLLCSSGKRAGGAGSFDRLG